MVKKKYSALVQPKIAKEDEVALTRQFKDISGKFKLSMGSALKIGAVAGATGLLMGWWNNQKKVIDSVNTSFNEYLSNTDRLGTIANDLQTNAGSFALTDLGLSTFGLNQEDRDKLYSSIKGAYAEGKIENVGEGNILGSFKFIQDEYKKALASGDVARQEYLKGLTGLRGQKATEFLSGNLDKSIDDMVDKLIKDPKIQELYGKNLSKAGLRAKLTEAVNKGGDLEAEQAQSLALQQAKTLLQVNKLASNGIIKSQEQYNEALKESTLAQYDSYDAMIKQDIARQNIIRNLLTAVNYWLDPIIGDLSTITVDNAEKVIFKIVKDFLTKLWDHIKEGFTIGLSKLLKLILPKWLADKIITPKSTETDKNNVNNSNQNNNIG